MMSTTSEKKHIYLEDLHFENITWLNELEFYKDEIGLFENRLEELVRKNTNTEMLAKLEQLQNQFIRHKEVIDEYRHDIKLAEQALAKEAKDNPVAIEHRYFDDHTETRDKMIRFKELYVDLKKEFFRFTATWM